MGTYLSLKRPTFHNCNLGSKWWSIFCLQDIYLYMVCKICKCYGKSHNFKFITWIMMGPSVSTYNSLCTKTPLKQVIDNLCKLQSQHTSWKDFYAEYMDVWNHCVLRLFKTRLREGAVVYLRIFLLSEREKWLWRQTVGCSATMAETNTTPFHAKVNNLGVFLFDTVTLLS